MGMDNGRSGAAAPSGSRPTDGAACSVSTPVGASIPNADDDPWFCERGDFWGTAKQLCLCAKCGKNEIKRHDEPRHFRGIFTARLHMICDECFESLPDDESPASAIEARSDATPKSGAAVGESAAPEGGDVQ